MSESQPLDDLRIDHYKVVQIVKLLCEGMGIRPTARFADCHRDTVLSVLETNVSGNKLTGEIIRIAKRERKT